VIKSMKSKSCS